MVTDVWLVTNPMPWSMVMEVAPVTFQESVTGLPVATVVADAVKDTMVGGLVGLGDGVGVGVGAGVGVGVGAGVGVGVGVDAWPIQIVKRETALPKLLVAIRVYRAFCWGVTVTDVRLVTKPIP